MFCLLPLGLYTPNLKKPQYKNNTQSRRMYRRQHNRIDKLHNYASQNSLAKTILSATLASVAQWFRLIPTAPICTVKPSLKQQTSNQILQWSCLEQTTPVSALKESHTHFVEDYLVLIEKLRALESKPRVWIVKPPPIFNETLGYSIEGLAKGVIPAIEEVAGRAEVPFIDVYSALTDSRYFFDGVHPNDEGAKVIARMVCQAVVLK